MGTLYWDLESTFTHCLVKVPYVELTGDLASGVLLSQLAYWFRPTKAGHSRLRVVGKDGRLVLAKQRDDWYSECGITLKQYRRAIKRLEELSLVKVTVEGFAGSRTTHIWLDVPLLEQLMIGVSGTKGPIDTGPKGPQQKAQRAHPYIYTETLTEKHPEEQKEKDVQGKTLAEVLTDLKQTKPVEGSNVKAMTMLWKKRMSLYTPEYVKELTGMEKGMLKHVHSALGEKAIVVLDAVLSDWSAFAKAVSEEKGVNIPLTPSCALFAKHYEIGLQLIAPVKSKETSPEVIVVKPFNLGHTDEQKATVNDVTATLEALSLLKNK